MTAAPITETTEATKLSTAPEAPPRRTPGKGFVVTLRRWWRQLTSMRTALVLLFLLAVAAVPGSIFPQRNLDLAKVSNYFAEYPDAAPILNRLWAFDVYASPWFGAIYLLLFVSLVGCLVPRMRLHVRAMLRQPPDAPKRLDRLPVSARVASDATAATIAATLRRRRWRVAVRQHGDVTTVSAEKGFLRETGNLLFHFSLLAILIGVAWGSAYGWYGNRLLVAGEDQAFCSSLQQYDDYGLGSRAGASDLPPLCLELRDFEGRYLENGQAEHYSAQTRYTLGDSAPRDYTLEVNKPLRLAGGNVYLVGHGYAPVIRYTDRYGLSQTTVAPFLPTDLLLTSEGVAAFPDANIDPATGRRDKNAEVGFQGIYLPTVPEDVEAAKAGHSAFPEERDPRLFLVAYRGDLGMDSGIPRSVYSLDQHQVDTGRLKMLNERPKPLRPGESWTLDDGSTVEFVETREWMTLQVRHDPGAPLVLVAAVLLLVGLLASLSVRRRRVWFRLLPEAGARSPGAGAPAPGADDGGPGDGRTIVEAGGLARAEYAGFDDEFSTVVAQATDTSPAGTGSPPTGTGGPPAGTDSPVPAKERDDAG
ncbi:MAG: cytochrome c biogenesis protein ResB [Micromonosporaceae bacterium]